MEIAQLNRLLLELSPSEQRYREGDVYVWAGSNDRAMVDGRSVLQMDQGVNGSPRYLDATVGQGVRRPMADLILLRRNSRFNPVPEHIHSHIEISYVYAGSCPQTVNGRAMTLHENQVLLLDTNCPHSIGSLGESDIMMSLVLSREFLRDNLLGSFTHESMLGHFIVNALNEQTDHRRYVRFHSDNSRRIRRYFQEFMCEYFDPTSNAERVLINLLQLIFAELISVYEEDYLRRDEDRGSVSVIPIIRYIEKHYRTCTQEGVAERFAISPNYVTTLLKRHTGMTYIQAVQAQRLGHATSLLRNTDRTVDDIAHEVGYENTTFFYRKFREAYGVAPAEYRARHRGRTLA